MFSLAIFRMMLPYLKKLGPKSLRRWILDRVPIKAVRRLKEITDIAYKNTKQLFYSKKTALQAGDDALKEQVANGKDLISILCKWEYGPLPSMGAEQ